MKSWVTLFRTKTVEWISKNFQRHEVCPQLQVKNTQYRSLFLSLTSQTLFDWSSSCLNLLDLLLKLELKVGWQSGEKLGDNRMKSEVKSWMTIGWKIGWNLGDKLQVDDIWMKLGWNCCLCENDEVQWKENLWTFQSLFDTGSSVGASLLIHDDLIYSQRFEFLSELSLNVSTGIVVCARMTGCNEKKICDLAVLLNSVLFRFFETIWFVSNHLTYGSNVGTPVRTRLESFYVVCARMTRGKEEETCLLASESWFELWVPILYTIVQYFRYLLRYWVLTYFFYVTRSGNMWLYKKTSCWVGWQSGDNLGDNRVTIGWQFGWQSGDNIRDIWVTRTFWDTRVGDKVGWQSGDNIHEWVTKLGDNRVTTSTSGWQSG